MTGKNPMKWVGVLFVPLGALLCAGALAALFILGTGEEMWVLPFVLGMVGGIFVLMGTLFLLLGRGKSERFKTRLREEGERVLAEVVALEPNISISVNGRHPSRLVCRVEEEGRAFLYRSENIWGYPRVLTHTVVVYRDPAHPRRYYVDLDGVLEDVVEL